MNSQGEFHDDAIPVVGSCVTGRVWRVHEDGVLTGVSYQHPWVKGENRAHCPYAGLSLTDKPEQPESWRPSRIAFYAHGSRKSNPHRPGAMGCACGWWSYHDHSMSSSWIHAGRGYGVTGVIFAHGLMTRGTKGYRSEFASIAALVRPEWVDRDDDADFPVSRERWNACVSRYGVPILSTLDEAFIAASFGTAA